MFHILHCNGKQVSSVLCCNIIITTFRVSYTIEVRDDNNCKIMFYDCLLL